MVDDFGSEAFRAEVEKFLGRQLEDLAEPPRAAGNTEHLGINPQKQDGLYYIGFPVYLGIVTGRKLVQVADVAESVGGDIRLTRQQNFIVANVPEREVERVIREIGEIGFPLDVNRLRGTSQGCTGSPLCNFAVSETKTRLDDIVRHLEATFGRAAEGIVVNVDGCPHACAHHWTADIGLQGSTLRERGAAGEKLEAYEIYLRGSLGDDAAIGRPIVRRVPAPQAKFHVERLIRAYLAEHEPGERFKQYADRKSDEELIAIASARPLADVQREAAASKTRGRGAVAVAADE
jgi:ferredoxin-nitrite reductase